MDKNRGGATLEDLREGQDALGSLIASLDKRTEVSTTELKSLIAHMARDVTFLLSTVRDGNGKQPLTTRVHVLERDLQQVLAAVHAIEAKLDEVSARLENPAVAVESTRGKWTAFATIVVATLSMVGTVLVAILK